MNPVISTSHRLCAALKPARCTWLSQVVENILVYTLCVLNALSDNCLFLSAPASHDKVERRDGVDRARPRGRDQRLPLLLARRRGGRAAIAPHRALLSMHSMGDREELELAGSRSDATAHRRRGSHNRTEKVDELDGQVMA